MNHLPCTVTACRGAGAKKACIHFCAITLYTLRLLDSILCPSTMFFSPRTCSLPFRLFYSSSEMNMLLVNLVLLMPIFRGAATPQPPWFLCWLCLTLGGSNFATFFIMSHPHILHTKRRNKRKYKNGHPHCKKYLVKMTTSAWLLQFQGSLNRWIV